VPEEVVALAARDAKIVDTAPLNLDEIIALIEDAHASGQDVARVHSGDPSLYGAIAEQIRRLEDLGIAYSITPGVPAYAAAAAELGIELTLPDVSQSVVLTRTAVRSSAMPNDETLENFAKTGATLAIHLSINNLAKVVRDLSPILGADATIVVIYRASWPDQQVITGTLADIRDKVKAAGITRTALILVGKVLENRDFSESRLYAADHHHVLRPKASSSQARTAAVDETMLPKAN
jgi:precorrin-4/cobalt-precorrin-4 C11-methyltransferase